MTGDVAEVIVAVLPDGHGEVLKDKFQISSVKANAEAVASMRSHRLREREQPEILERRMPVRGGFASVGLGVDDRSEDGEIAVFIDRRFVPAFAL